MVDMLPPAVLAPGPESGGPRRQRGRHADQSPRGRSRVEGKAEYLSRSNRGLIMDLDSTGLMQMPARNPSNQWPCMPSPVATTHQPFTAWATPVQIGIEIECRRQTPAMAARVIQEPGIAQVIISAADQKIKNQAAPQLMDVGNRVGSFLQQDIHQFSISTRHLTLGRTPSIRVPDSCVHDIPNNLTHDLGGFARGQR